MEKEYQKIIGTFHNDAEKAQKKLLKNFEKFIVKFAKKNWQKFLLKFLKILRALSVSIFPTTKLPHISFPMRFILFRETTAKRHISFLEKTEISFGKP